MTNDPGRGSAAVLLSAASILAWTVLGNAPEWPSGFPAELYAATHVAPVQEPEARALAEALPGVVWSGCLTLAAQAVLAETLAIPDPRLPDDRLHVLTRAAGCTDPLPRLLVIDTSEASTVDVVTELERVNREADGPATHAGMVRAPIDRGRFRWRWVVILSARPAELASTVSRLVAPGAAVPLRVHLLGNDLVAPTAVVARPDGELRRYVLDADGESWWTLLQAGTTQGELTVQLFAESDVGPRLAAVLDLWVGTDLPEWDLDHWSTSEPRAFDSVEAARLWMVSRLNALRREAGVGALVPDAALDRVATAHCEDMRRSGFVGHRSPTTGELPDRLQAAGVGYRSARENVAWAGGVESAMRQLEHSPAHRANLLAPDVDRIGIGLVATPDGGDLQRRWLVTQVLVGSTHGFSVQDILDAAADGVDAARERRDLPPAARCPELDAAATTLADEPFASALDADTCFVRVRAGLGARPERWGSLQLAVVRVNDPEEVRLPEILTWDGAVAWGVAARHLPVAGLPPFQIVWVAAPHIPRQTCD